MGMKARLKRLSDYKAITPKMITKSIIDVFIRGVILIDKHYIVIAIMTNKDTTIGELKTKRKEIAQKLSALEGNIEVDRPFKSEHLHSKVVLR